MANTALIAARLNQLMQEQNITAADIVQRTNSAKASVNAWIAGEKMPKWDKAFALADLFQVSLNYLMGGPER